MQSWMNVLKFRSRSYAQTFFVLQRRKCISGNLNISATRFVASLITEQGTVHCDGIHIFNKTSTSLSKYTAIACGFGFTILCSNDQQLLVSGVNSRSQLGVPSYHNKLIDKFTKVELSLTKADSDILHMSCGRLHTVVSTMEGLFASGCNKLGQCGLGNKEEITHFSKIPWSTSTPVKQVACGLEHTLVLTASGEIWSCGWGADGQTGLGHTNEQRSLALVELPSRVKIKKIATNSDSCLGLSDCGDVFSWGNSEYNQLAFPMEETLTVKPTKIAALENVVDIAIGNSVGLALTDKGNVFTWGYGLLGNDFEPSFTPTPQKLTSLKKRVVKVDCGLDYYVLSTDDNEVYLWGKLNHKLYSPLPKKVNLAPNILQISCGVDHMAIIVDY